MSLFNGVGSNLHHSGTPPQQPDIDEILEVEFEWSVKNNKTVRFHTIKTAIYEIGLECIGAEEAEELKLAKEPETAIVYATRNALRDEQRKAWAKACGVE